MTEMPILPNISFLFSICNIFTYQIPRLHRYVRFASAAYGVSMIDSADLLQAFNKKIVTVPIVSGASEKARIHKTCQYLGLQPKDIVAMTNPGGNKDLVNHFIAIDRPRGKLKGAVVLAIRGTYTLSGVKTDAALYSKKFCHGRAHAGIADAANNLWEHVKEDIVKALRSNPDYDLVLVGHSLGAGTAALLTLKLKYEDILANEDNRLKHVKIRCYAFAPPPVYTKKMTVDVDKLNEAMSDTYAFIHENDCVPFASANALRRLSDLMVKVDKYPKGIFGSSPLMAAGVVPIPDELKDMVFEEPKLEYMDGAEKLAIPSPYVMWMRKFSYDNKGRPMYNTMFCRPKGGDNTKGTNDLNFLIDDRMISDHMNPQYERAINSVREQMLSGESTRNSGWIFRESGYVFPPNANTNTYVKPAEMKKSKKSQWFNKVNYIFVLLGFIFICNSHLFEKVSVPTAVEKQLVMVSDAQLQVKKKWHSLSCKSRVCRFLLGPIHSFQNHPLVREMKEQNISSAAMRNCNDDVLLGQGSCM